MNAHQAHKAARVALGGDSDLNKAGWLKNKCMKLGLAVSQPSQHMGWGCCSAFSFQSYGQPQAPLPQPMYPCKGTIIPSGTGMTKAPRSHGSPLILLQRPAPALPGGVGWGVAPSRAVQPQLLAPAEMLGAGVHLHPWHLCTGLEKGSAPRCRWLPTHGARHRLCQGPTRGRAYPGQRAIGRRWQCRGHCVPHTRTGPRPPAARG